MLHHTGRSDRMPQHLAHAQEPPSQSGAEGRDETAAGSYDPAATASYAALHRSSHASPAATQPHQPVGHRNTAQRHVGPPAGTHVRELRCTNNALYCQCAVLTITTRKGVGTM